MDVDRKRTVIDRAAVLLRPWAVAFAGLLLMRALLLAQSSVPAQQPALILLADAMTALALVLLRPVALPSPWPIFVYAPLIALVYHLAGTHAEIHGSFFRLAHFIQALDGEFLSSTLSWHFFGYFPLYLTVASGWLFALTRSVPSSLQPSKLRRRPTAVLLLGLLAGYYLLTPSPTHPSNNPLLATAVQIPGAFWRASARDEESILVVPDAETDPVFFLRDQSGQARSARPNVLLILVEGLSGAYLPSVARHHGLAPDLALPELDRQLQQYGFQVFPNAVSMQRQTHRGTYSVLCGDYPRITTSVPKMTLVASAGAPIECLPRVLKDAGYRTAYVQAAPLSFMDKDVFMPLAGFEEVVGRAELDALGVPSEGWGADDGVFLGAAFEQIRALQAGNRPWFATLLNVATHHPFTHDEVDTGPDAVLIRRTRAFELLTQALAELLRKLQQEGVLDNTLVIVSSDEAGGFQQEGNLREMLPNNFGMMALRMPGKGQWPQLAPAETLVAHMDVAVTVLDLLGLDDVSNMIGSSMLHNPHRRPRGLLFGDTYSARSYFLYDHGELVACDETLLRCQTWHFDPKRMFGTLVAADTTARLGLSARNRIVGEASLIRDVGVATVDRYRIAPGTITRRRAYLGGQKMPITDGDVLEVTVEAQALPEDESTLREGNLRVVMLDGGNGDLLEEREIRVQGTYPLTTKLLLPAPKRPVKVDVDLHWEPDDDRDELAVRSLDVRRKPDPAARRDEPPAPATAERD